jgi:para-nitrobenzyl esterase
MTLRVFALPVLALALLATPVAAQTLKVTGGQIAQAAPTTDGVRVYKGLPYAAPPVGERRWKPPRPSCPGPARAPSTPTRPIACSPSAMTTSTRLPRR